MGYRPALPPGGLCKVAYADLDGRLDLHDDPAARVMRRRQSYWNNWFRLRFRLIVFITTFKVTSIGVYSSRMKSFG